MSKIAFEIVRFGEALFPRFSIIASLFILTPRRRFTLLNASSVRLLESIRIAPAVICYR